MKVLREAEEAEVPEKKGEKEALSKGTLREFQKDQGVQEVKKTQGLWVVTLWGGGGGVEAAAGRRVTVRSVKRRCFLGVGRRSRRC
jgi:hypothetical protein